VKHGRVALSIVLLAVSSLRDLGAQSTPACSEPRDACAFFTSFVSAFNRRDWPAFQATLDPDVSVIFDHPGPPARQDGHMAVEAVFHLIFPDAPAVDGASPSQIRPLQLRTQDFGDVVVVSFQLADPDATGRRTLVLHRTSAGWKIAHIHGSSSTASKTETSRSP
jgi:ketosteroid isomerase-like protein